MRKEITVIVTSCGRFDLLEQTLDSFHHLNIYPIHSHIIKEDSGKIAHFEKIYAKYRHRFSILFDKGNRSGLSKSLDHLLSEVTTDYVFTCEDDWFFAGNPNFIQDSLTILEHNPDIHQVWIRNPKDHGHPLGKPYLLNGIEVQDVLPGYQTHWNGFSLNPGLRRMSDLKLFFPNGLREYGDEIICAQRTAQFDYRAVSLVNHACKHIGYGRHTANFKV